MQLYQGTAPSDRRTTLPAQSFAYEYPATPDRQTRVINREIIKRILASTFARDFRFPAGEDTAVVGLFTTPTSGRSSVPSIYLLIPHGWPQAARCMNFWRQSLPKLCKSTRIDEGGDEREKIRERAKGRAMGGREMAGRVEFLLSEADDRLSPPKNKRSRQPSPAPSSLYPQVESPPVP